MKLINKFKSLNFNKRKNCIYPSLIIIHYTAMLDYHIAIDYLLNPINKVSSHYLISKKGIIYNLVSNKQRAWHAGLSYWDGEKDINSHSIGIELDNSGPLNKNESFTFLQLESLMNLLSYLKKQFSISEYNILGHSDISPYRKMDPGSKFPWLKLEKRKLSFLPSKITNKQNDELENYFLKRSLKQNKSRILHMLNQIGYDIKPAINCEDKYSLLIKAYQMHYYQSKANGRLDIEFTKLLKGHFNEILTKRI